MTNTLKPWSDDGMAVGARSGTSSGYSPQGNIDVTQQGMENDNTNLLPKPHYIQSLVPAVMRNLLSVGLAPAAM